MSYTNPTGNSSATINENAQDLYIFTSAEGSSYTPDPYAKILTMSGGAAVTYTNVTISSGGTADVAKSTLMRNVTVSSGGSMIYREGANFKDLTVESGGWASNIGNSIVFSNFEIKSGATVALTNAKLYGRNNSVAANTLAGNLRANSDSVDGVLCGVSQLGGAFNYYDIVMSNFTNAGGYTYMNNGVEILNGSAITAGKGFAFNGSAYIKNLNVTKGRVWTHLAGAAVSLGGAETYIKQGSWYHCACDGSTNQDTALYADKGVLYGVDLYTSGYRLRNLTILDGLTISAPVVNSGGKLFIGSGGSGAAITVNNAGSAVVLSNGSATGLTVNNGGSAIVSSGARVATTVVENGGKVSLATGAVLTEAVTVSDGGKLNYDGAGLYNLVVKAGGSASAGTNGAGYHGVTVESGGYLRMRTANIYGTFDVKANTLAGFITSPEDSVDGVFVGGSHNAGALHYFGTPMSDYHVTAAAYTYIAQGAYIRDAYAEVAGGGFAFEGDGYIYNARVTNGSMWMHNKGANVSLGGAETYIEKGHFYQNNCAGTGTPDPNLYASGGVLYDVLIKNNGYNWLRKLTVLEGLTISGAVMSSGGSLTLGAGGSGNDLTVSGYGRLYVSNGGVATNAHGKGAMYAYDGGIITSATVESTGAMHVSSGGVANDIAVDSGAKLYVSSGATVNRLTVNVGNLNATNMHAVFHNGAAGNDISIYGDKNSNQYNVSAYGNAVLSKVYQSGGGLWVYENATVKDLTVEKGEMVFQDTAYGSDVKVSGGTAILYVRNNALVENLHMSAAEARFAAGTVRNAVFEGAIGQLKVGENFLMESASFDKGAVVSVTSGGRLDSATVNNGAQLQVSKGGEVTNLVLNGGANANRIRLYDGGHISGATISGTDGTRNYISALTGSGLIEDVTTEKAGIYLASGGIIRNVTLSNCQVILRGEHPYASGATVSGGGAQLFFQNGAKGQDVVVNGGYMYVHDDGYAGEVIGSGAKVSGADLLKGEIKVSAGGKLFDLRASGGSVTVKSTGTTYGDPLLSGAVFTGGVLTLSGGAVAKNIKLDGGGAIYGENATLEDFDIEAPDVKGKKLAISGAAMIASGGRINGSNNVGIMDLTGGATFNEAYVSGGSVFLSGLATITNVEQTGGAVILRGEESYVSGATVLGGTLHIQNGGKGDDITIAGGSITIASGGTVNNLNATGGRINVSSAAVLNVEATNVLNNINTYAGARVNFVEHATGVMLQGSNTNIAASTFYYAGAAQALGFTVTNGVVENLGADGKAYRLSVGDEIVVNDAIVTDNCRVSGFAGAVLNRLSISGKTAAASVVLTENARSYDAVLTGSNGKTTLLAISGSVIAYDTTVNSGGTLRFNGPTAYASGTVVNSGGKIEYNTGMGGFGHIEDTTLKAGATLTLSDGADTGDKLTLDFTGATGNQSLTINDLGYVADTTTIMLVGETAGNTYTIATTGATDKYVNCGEWGLYDDSIKAGESITNAFTGMTYDFNAAGTAIAVSEFTAAAQATAGSIEDGTTINGNGKAAKWTSTTTATGIITAATSAIAGDAWLEIDGTDMGGTTLFGAEVGFAGEVNLYATGDAVINNLAAGATSSGTVAGVKLTVDGATVGLAYAGGFGTVANAAETLIEEGTFTKDFYAGALANYAKTGHATQVGSVSLTITDGEFSGNIYGASAVKAGAATSLVHSVGDVTITVKDGESKKGAQACLFAGGYATGTVASDSAVYTVNNIDVTIDGGNWGAAAGGRGVFGGIFASKVTAVAEDVTLTINGGTMGNVYGGGWAQQGGASIVDDVYIDITGGTIANVFGGGTHSTTGGTTVVDDVTINVSGGNITGAIYAGGQQTGDTVAGDEIGVTFTGDSNFACGVYGYSYDGGMIGDAALFYTAYVGTFSGAIGGFATITLDDDTAMTLATAAADVSNGKWEFDFTDRADTLAGTSFLTWSGADFAGDTVRVNFTDADQAAAGWNIATADFTGATFTLAINDTDITTVAYDTAISGGDWNGWGFTLDNGTLKFKNLA